MKWFQAKRSSGKNAEMKSQPHTDAPGGYILPPYRSFTDNEHARSTYSVSSPGPYWGSEILRTSEIYSKGDPVREFLPYPVPKPISVCANMRKSDAYKTCENKPVVWEYKNRSIGLAYCEECILLYWNDCERRGDTHMATFYDSDGRKVNRL